MKGIEIKGGESAEFRIPVSTGQQVKDIDVDLEAKCQCGGKMIKVKHKLEWRCKYDKWWNLWNKDHAHLVATLQTSGNPQIDY